MKREPLDEKGFIPVSAVKTGWTIAFLSSSNARRRHFAGEGLGSPRFTMVAISQYESKVNWPSVNHLAGYHHELPGFNGELMVVTMNYELT